MEIRKIFNDFSETFIKKIDRDYYIDPHIHVFFENINEESLDILYLGMKDM